MLFFFNLGLSNLGIIFMNTTYQDCYERMVKQRWDITEVNKRMKIFEEESQTRDISDIIVEPNYIISNVNYMVKQILK